MTSGDYILTPPVPLGVTLQNILTCKSIISQHISSQISSGNICYDDIFSEDFIKASHAIKFMKNKYDMREEHLREQVLETSGSGDSDARIR